LHVRVEQSGRDFRFTLALHPEDNLDAVGQQAMSIALITDTTMVRLPAEVGEPHPDLIALAAILVARPWATKRLTVEGGLSTAMAGTIGRALSLEVGPVDTTLSARSPGSRLGLMYSGGPDCMAAELLIGETLPLLHLRRVKHPRIPNRSYGGSHAIEALVLEAAERGEEVHVARSDMEFLSRPFPTYPQWTSMAIGAVLQAEQLSLGGLVTGRNVSGMYLGWGNGFDPEGDNEAEWKAVFSAAGLPLVQPLAGTSDISSKAMARDHRLHDLSRSCIVGTVAGPCLRCKKCVMTELIQAIASGRAVDPALNQKFASEAAAIGFLAKGPPFANQHLLEFALPRLPDVETTVFSDARKALTRGLQETEWVNRYYRPALEQHVPEGYRPRVEAEIEKRMEFMDSDDEKMLESWVPGG
jgi:hypothetical protein